MLAGSSPRMRGAPVERIEHGLQHGIIPAYAGSTTACRTRCPARRDHPRVCGEHQSPSSIPRVRSGSSPRMRGARGAAGRYLHVHGIIPAYAGSTTRPSNPSSWRRDHPRVCGEHHFAVMITAFFPGSSPRMRGALISASPALPCIGIIPAYAGSTVRHGRFGSRSRDHPRVCGEHSFAIANGSQAQGSSPRMRGARF